MLSKNQIREIQGLQLRKNRDLRREFIAEGIKTVTEIIEKNPEIIKTIYATESFLSGHIDRFRNLKFLFVKVSEEELKKISVLSAPNKVMAVCSYLDELSVPVHDGSTALFLDDIRDPGNFGTILRLASWFGISTVFCSPSSCELYNPKVIQSTMGAFLSVRVIYSSLEEVTRVFQLPVYGAVLDGVSLYDLKLREGILVIGNEANGISAENLERVSHPVTIPASVKNETESLNAAMATSVIVAEFFRQGILK